MGKGRVRLKGGAKGSRWAKGRSSESNPTASKHRTAARGRFGNHLSVGKLQGAPLTASTLAAHDSTTKEDDSEGISPDDLGSLGTSSSAITSSSVYSLVETAHPVFGSVRRFWKTASERQQSVLATLAAVSEVVKDENGKETETEYFAVLLTALEVAEDELTAMALAFLLGNVTPRVPENVLKANFGSVVRIISGALTKFGATDDASLLRSAHDICMPHLAICHPLVQLLGTLVAVFVAQSSPAVWAEMSTKKIFNLLLMYTMHPKPKVANPVRMDVILLLKEGGERQSGEPLDTESQHQRGFHPCAQTVALYIQEQVESGSGGEKGTLCLLDLLKGCMANFPTQTLKSLCELILQQMTLASSEVKLAGLWALNGLFASVAGPQGLTAHINGQLITALYDYQPSPVDVQTLVVWLQVMENAHISLHRLSTDLCLPHLVKFFSTAMDCLLADSVTVQHLASSAMKTVLTKCVVKATEGLQLSQTHKQSLQAMFKCVQRGLKYKFYRAWLCVFDVLRCWYQHLGGTQCNDFLTASLAPLCDLRDTPNFPHTSALDGVLGSAIAAMGPRVVLSAVPLQLNADRHPYDFPRSWMLPLLREYISNTELAYFSEAILPLANQLGQKAKSFLADKKLLEAKLFSTVELQLWETLPGFCMQPTDVKTSFRLVAKVMGTALSNRSELRVTVCASLRNVVETCGDEEDRKELSSFAKNYLPILFNLYTAELKEGDTNRAYILDCVRSYASIAPRPLMGSFFSKILNMLRQSDLAVDDKYLVADLAQVLASNLPEDSLSQLYKLVLPLIASSQPRPQKKAYQMLYHLASSKELVCVDFAGRHVAEIAQSLLDSSSCVCAGSRRPRLQCLTAVVDQLSSDHNEFLLAILPEAVLGMKETNERARSLACDLVVKMGYAAHRCSQLSPQEAATDFLTKMLAGLAGSPHLVSGTILSLSRLVYEFHDLLGSEMVESLLGSVCLLLRAKSREVVKAAMGFVKVIIGVLPPADLAPHLKDLVQNLLSWSEDGKHHFRLKARYIFEKLFRKVGYKAVSNVVPEKHRKFVSHAHKMVERRKRKKKALHEEEEESGGESESSPQKLLHKSIPTYEELLYDSSSDEDEEALKEKQARGGRSKGGHAWIKEGEKDEPLDFLDTGAVKRVLGTDPASAKLLQRKRPAGHYPTADDGRLIVADDRGEGSEAHTDENPMETSANVMTSSNKESAHFDIDEGESDTPNVHTSAAYKGGGRGIHRVAPKQRRVEGEATGVEYKSKRAGGDIKQKGKPDPYAYIPLNRQKLNRRKQAKLQGQFKQIVRSAHKGSSLGRKKVAKLKKGKRR